MGVPTRSAVAALVAAGLLLSAGCAPDPQADPGVAVRASPGVPDDVEAPGGIGDPFATWIDTGATFAIVTYGSSSCPPTAAAIESSSDRVEVTFERSTAEICTADLAPTTHVFDLPASVIDRPVAVVATFPGDGSTLTLDFTLE